MLTLTTPVPKGFVANPVRLTPRSGSLGAVHPGLPRQRQDHSELWLFGAAHGNSAAGRRGFAVPTDDVEMELGETEI